MAFSKPGDSAAYQRHQMEPTRRHSNNPWARKRYRKPTLTKQQPSDRSWPRTVEQMFQRNRERRALSWRCCKSLEKPIKRGEYEEASEPRKCRKPRTFEPATHIVGPAEFIWDQIRCSRKVPASIEWISSIINMRTSNCRAAIRVRWRSAVELKPAGKTVPSATKSSS